MRTTIDLPDELHHAAMMIARDRHQTLSRTVGDLLRAGLDSVGRDIPLEIDPDTGFPLVRVGRRITAEDVARADED